MRTQGEVKQTEGVVLASAVHALFLDSAGFPAVLLPAILSCYGCPHALTQEHPPPVAVPNNRSFLEHLLDTNVS